VVREGGAVMLIMSCGHDFTFGEINSFFRTLWLVSSRPGLA
jgi:hypothetical protein